MSINVQVTQPDNVNLTITTGNAISVDLGLNGDMHNSLVGLQGGSQAERFHLTQNEHDKIVYQTGAQIISGIKTFRNEIYVSGIKFDVLGTGANPVPAYEQGLLFYDDANHTLNLYVDNPEVTLQLGQENWVRVKNTLNAPVFDGDLVYIAGGVGANPYIQLAIASGESTSATTLGMATHDIGNNEFGYVTTFGLVNNVNTKNYAVGDTLYLSPTISGKFTNVKPKAPQHMVRVGTVIRANENNGVIFVNIQNGFEVDELHNVRIISPQNNQALLYNSASGVWNNRAITTGDVSGLYDFVLSTESEFTTINEVNSLIELNPSKANRWSVPALRVNNYYTSEGFINIYQISSGELFGSWGLIDDIDPTYPIWQSLVNDTSRCLLYKDTDSQEKLLSPFLNNANPIIATPSTDLPPWEKTWSGQSGYAYNNVQIDLVDKYQINSISEQPPSNPNAGDSWFNNQNGKTFFYYVNSGESVGQWIQI